MNHLSHESQHTALSTSKTSTPQTEQGNELAGPGFGLILPQTSNKLIYKEWRFHLTITTRIRSEQSENNDMIAIYILTVYFRSWYFLVVYVRVLLWGTIYGRGGLTVVTLHCLAGPLEVRIICSETVHVAEQLPF